MTKTQVTESMGTPHYVRHDTLNTTTFYYGGLRKLKRCILEVYFDAGGRVTGKFHDG